MFEKKLYTLCAVLSLSCSAYAMKEGIDEDKSASSSSLRVRSAYGLEVARQEKKDLLSELEKLKVEHEKSKTQAAKGAKFTPLELLRMASARGPFL